MFLIFIVLALLLIWFIPFLAKIQRYIIVYSTVIFTIALSQLGYSYYWLANMPRGLATGGLTSAFTTIFAWTVFIFLSLTIIIANTTKKKITKPFDIAIVLFGFPLVLCLSLFISVAIEKSHNPFTIANYLF